MILVAKVWVCAIVVLVDPHLSAVVGVGVSTPQYRLLMEGEPKEECDARGAECGVG